MDASCTGLLSSSSTVGDRPLKDGFGGRQHTWVQSADGELQSAVGLTWGSWAAVGHGCVRAPCGLFSSCVTPDRVNSRGRVGLTGGPASAGPEGEHVGQGRAHRWTGECRATTRSFGKPAVCWPTNLFRNAALTPTKHIKRGAAVPPLIAGAW